MQDDTSDAPGSTPIIRLLNIMKTLRDPDCGCKWDVKQTFETIAPYTIEEAYEVVDAIQRRDMNDLKDELGDLLLQVVYHARIAEEQGYFAFDDVVEAINTKMIRRHPHVFNATANGDSQSSPSWDNIKAQEKALKSSQNANASSACHHTVFSEIKDGLPALLKSVKLQQKAAQLGFDWETLDPVFIKIEEELGELRAELNADTGNVSKQRKLEEYGDLVFVVVNLGLHLDIDPETALRFANHKFMIRMTSMLSQAQQSGINFQSLSLDQMEELWQQAKNIEKSGQLHT